MSFSQISTDPAGVQQASVEDITWGIDMTGYLVSGQSVTTPVCKLTNLHTKTTVTLTDACSIAGNIVSQRIRSGVLLKNVTYQLLVTFVVSPTTNTLATVLNITCPL